MKTLIRLIALAALLFALPAFGALSNNWNDDSTKTTDDNCDQSARDKVCYFTENAAGDTSPLNIRGRVCYIKFDDDTSTDTVGSGATALLKGCPADTANDNVCEEIYDDAGAVSFNGDGSAGRAAMYGVEGSWIYFTVTNAGSDVFMIEVGCRKTN